MQQHFLKNNQLLVLREAEPRDAERMLAYFEQVAGESEFLTYGPGEFGMTVEGEQDFLQAVAASPTSLSLLAEVEGALAGNLTFSTGKRPRIRHTGEFGISVARDYWGLGIGGYLLRYLINWARAGGMVRKINLHVRADNLAAMHLYEKHGFVQEGRVTREFYLHGTFHDVCVMGLQIDPQ
jgi:RimJ/RimL family protein N-acetyltransferase